MGEEKEEGLLSDAFKSFLDYGPIENPENLTDKEIELLKRSFFSGAMSFHGLCIDCGSAGAHQLMLTEIRKFLES